MDTNFSDKPVDKKTYEDFSGSAIVFLTTVAYPTRTASLQ